MGTPLNLRSKESYTRGSGALRSENCRKAVQILRAHNDAITVTELAERLVTSESTSTDESAVDSVRIRLHHVDLPKLAETGHLDWDKSAREVSPTDHPVYDGSSADEDGSVASSRASTIPALADDRRREILALIESECGPVTPETLARNVAARDADGEPSQSRIENVLVQLHHCHLPKLADAGLIEYDRGDGRITYQGPSELPPASRAASDA